MKYMTLILLLFVAFNINADVDYDKGVAASEAENYTEAFKWYMKSANKGNADAQNYLGNAYGLGRGTAKNDKEAYKWYLNAANQGHTEAQISIGRKYMFNEGYVKKDISKAVSWFIKAAEKDVNKVQYSIWLINIVLTGYGLKVDSKQLFDLMKKSANQGKFESIYLLAMMYFDGIGVPENKKEAFKLMKNIALQGYKYAQYNLGGMYFRGDGVKPDIQEAFKWTKKAAEQGLDRAQVTLGFLYFNGKGVEPDKQEAFRWYKKAAEQNHARAQLRLGDMYLRGQGTKENHKEAIKWFEKSAELGNEDAKKALDKRGKYTINKWNFSERSVMTFYMTNYLDSRLYQATVAFSKGAEKKFYFEILENADTCDPEDYKEKGLLSSVWEINSQAIEMTVFCNKGSDNYYYISATPRSFEGSRFVVNVFKKSSDTVLVRGAGYEFPISAKGFTRVWNKVSDRVL